MDQQGQHHIIAVPAQLDGGIRRDRETILQESRDYGGRASGQPAAEEPPVKLYLGKIPPTLEEFFGLKMDHKHYLESCCTTGRMGRQNVITLHCDAQIVVMQSKASPSFTWEYKVKDKPVHNVYRRNQAQAAAKAGRAVLNVEHEVTGELEKFRDEQIEEKTDGYRQSLRRDLRAALDAEVLVSTTTPPATSGSAGTTIISATSSDAAVPPLVDE
jgi:hypothetical protein